jgi:hypothetical protein
MCLYNAIVLVVHLVKKELTLTAAESEFSFLFDKVSACFDAIHNESADDLEETDLVDNIYKIVFLFLNDPKNSVEF